MPAYPESNAKGLPSEALRRSESGDSSHQLYLHVPFCERKCHYCDFKTWEAPLATRRNWVKHVGEELRLRSLPGEERVSTVFWGGGTPSFLTPSLFEELFRLMEVHHRVEHAEEFTVECNPSSLTREKLDLYAGLGVTRLSIGVQSFHPEELTLLGRVHSREVALKALEWVSGDGRFDFSADLIFGMPGQTSERFLESLKTLCDFHPDHVSFYGLTVEPGTEFERLHRQGRMDPADEDLYNDLYSRGVELLSSKGLERYEVSNFARPGCESKHNQGYWQRKPYLGFGPGAHSFWQGLRSANPGTLETYGSWVEQGCPTSSCETENLSVAQELAEIVFLGLRQASGLETQSLTHLLGSVSFESLFTPYVEGELLCLENGRARLVGDGWVLLDEIAARLLSGLEALCDRRGAGVTPRR